MPSIDDLRVMVCTVPTDAPESDGTLAWDSTTIVIVELTGGGRTGLGYTYGSAPIGGVVEGKLRDVVVGREALDTGAAWLAMVAALRNDGRPGISSMAIAAVDIALHDLRARLLELPLSRALGRFHDAVPVYGSGGFCAYSDARLAEQLGGWADEGMATVKMKVGRDAARDPERVRVAREAIGRDVDLLVDANGAYDEREAIRWAQLFAEHGATYIEEPVSSDDLDGLRFVRERLPASMAVAAGEYGYDLVYFERMLSAGAVDVQQVDVTRCAGITEFLRAGALCQAHGIPLSAHCAPAVSVHACCAVQRVFPMEYFHDHVRIEALLFDGTLQPGGGVLRPDPSRPGHGLELKRSEVERYAS